jgi:cell division protein FtsI (penicillin-binding protein 3)
VVLVLIDEPEVNVYGGVVAAPAFQNISRGALRQLGVVPDKPDAMPTLVVAGQDLARPNVQDPNGATVHDGTVSVPDLVGLSMRAALTKARALNMPVEVQGHGYVVKQSPQPGTPWEEGNKLILNLRG